MPPYVPRKRRSPEPAASEPSPKRVAREPRKGKKESVFAAVEATKIPARGKEKEQFLKQFEDSDSDKSALSDAESSSSGANAEGKSPGKSIKRKTRAQVDSANEASGSSSGEDEGDEWDDFIDEQDKKKHHKEESKDEGADENIEVTLEKARDIRRSDIKTSNEKKGPSKIERQIRNSTHQLHVMFLMYHNHVRNHWINNKELQSVLLKQLPAGCKDEIERWKNACGDALQPDPDETERSGDKTKASKGKGNRKSGRHSKNIRDWGPKANETEEGNPDLSHGDPTLRLLKTLSAFWRKRFNKTAPGLRKRGYKSMERIQDELKGFRENPHDVNEYGEKIDSFAQFAELAKQAEGSRDVGAQLFTALLRAVGMKARLVANLQPAGFSWTKGEEADPPKKMSKADDKREEERTTPKSNKTIEKPKSKSAKKEESTLTKRQPKRQSKSAVSGKKNEPIDLEDSDSPLSDPPSSPSDNESVVDITTSRPIQQRKRYDGDLKFPHYWTEALSPITNCWIPVDPIVLSLVANNIDSHSVFEPRGAGADHTKQVFAYVVAFNSDGTAKDVTTRYLKRHMWPGKTKGMRYPIEKVPIYNRKGKIIRHVQYDWFGDVMGCYQDPGAPKTKADILEDSRELKPVRPQSSTNTDKAPQESLQYYKTSAEFVLEKHLRREEALLPSAEIVKTFSTGKGDKAQSYPVYKRSDVVTCKSSESWHKEGRQIKVGEQPLKKVPMRAVTAIRKAEVEQAERETGEKMLQALFSKEQTEWIIPPPIQDGVIPKNAYGNMDVYVPTMVPEGASHVPLRGTAKICKKLGIDFAEACTGFEFGNRMAVPVLTGVVVAEENRKMLVDAWREEEKIRKEKEAKKNEKLALGMWRKLLAGLRVVERVRREYGGDDMKVDYEVHKEMEKEGKGVKGGAGGKKKQQQKKGKTKDEAIELDEEDIEEPTKPTIGFPEAVEDVGETGGGFLPEGMDVEILDRKPKPIPDNDDDLGGGFVIEEDEKEEVNKRDALSNGANKPMKSLREHAAAFINGEGAEADQQDDEDPQASIPNGVDLEKENIEEPQSTPAPKKRGRPSTARKNTPKTNQNVDVSTLPTSTRTSRVKSNKSTPAKTPKATPAKRGRKRAKSPSPLTDEEVDDDKEEIDGEWGSDGYNPQSVAPPPAKRRRSRRNA